MRRIILLNKPYNVLPQFSDSEGREHLGHYVDQPGVYPAGRLDRDSEGLMVLTNDGALQHKISHPDHKMSKTETSYAGLVRRLFCVGKGT